MYKPYVGVFVIYIRCYLSLFLYFFCGSFAFASLKVSVDFKPWFESFQTILSEEKGTNEVVDLIESCGELSRKSDTSKMIREYFVANNLSSTDTLEEFLEKKEKNQDIKSIFDHLEYKNKTIESFFYEDFFLSKDATFPHSAGILILIKTLENETDMLKLFSKETANVFFLHSLYLFMMDIENACLIKIEKMHFNTKETGNFFVDFFKRNKGYTVDEYRKILKFYTMIIKDIVFVD